MDTNNKKKAAPPATVPPAAPGSSDPELPPWDNPALTGPALLAAGDVYFARLLAPATYRYYTKWPKPAKPRSLATVFRLLDREAAKPLPDELCQRLAAWSAGTAPEAALDETQLRGVGRRLEEDTRAYVHAASTAQINRIASLWPAANRTVRRTVVTIVALVCVFAGGLWLGHGWSIVAGSGLAGIPGLGALAGLADLVKMRRMRDPLAMSRMWTLKSLRAVITEVRRRQGKITQGNPASLLPVVISRADAYSNTPESTLRSPEPYSGNASSLFNPATGLPMLDASGTGVDVGGNPYGVDMRSFGLNSLNSSSSFSSSDF